MRTDSDKKKVLLRRFYLILGIIMIVLGFLLLPIPLLSIACFIIGAIELGVSRRYNSAAEKEKRNFTKEENQQLKLLYKHNNLRFFIYDDYTNLASGVKWLSKYTYDFVELFRPDPGFSELFEYDVLDVLQDPQNEYDNKAIVFKFHGNTIGYLYRGTLQDMANDYFSNGYEVHAQVQKVEDHKVFVKLFFCQPRSVLLEPVKPFRVKLVANQNAEMQDNLSYCSVSDEIFVEMDSDTNRYLVSVDNLDIGYIPNSKQDYLLELEQKCYCFSGKIVDLHENESTGKYSVSVEVQPQ